MKLYASWTIVMVVIGTVGPTNPISIYAQGQYNTLAECETERKLVRQRMIAPEPNVTPTPGQPSWAAKFVCWRRTT